MQTELLLQLLIFNNKMPTSTRRVYIANCNLSRILIYVRLPSDIPRSRTPLHRGATSAHVENVLQTLEFRFVREKLAVCFLPVVERLEKRKGEDLRR